MTARELHAILSHAAGARSDAELVADARDPAAFAALVRRHGPLVWTACRRMLPEADAADAFQAVFLALAKSAGRIRTPAVVGGWLHAAAVRVCLKLRRDAARRRLREKRAARPEAVVPVADAAWEAILAAVHEEIEQLPDGERTAFVVCELQGVPQAEAASRLGWKPGTLTGRLSKARAKLLTRLSARGFAPGVGLVGLVAVPTEVAASAAGCVGPAVSVSPAVVALSREVTAMIATKHLAAAVLVAGGLLAGVGGVVVRADGEGGGMPQPPVPKKADPLLPPVAKPKYFPPDPAVAVWSYDWAGPKWEHQTVPTPGMRAEFDQLLAARGRDGWEFAGMVKVAEGPVTVENDGRGRVSRAAESIELVVFKRPAPVPAPASTAPGSLTQPPPPPGFGRGAPDADMVWEFVSKGQPSIDLNDAAHARIRERMQREGQALPADGILTKEAFKANFQAGVAKRTASGSPDGNPVMPVPVEMTDAQVKEWMRRSDTDWDGRISAAEAEQGSGGLRDGFAQHDVNRDGFIDVGEYRRYAAARLATRTVVPPPTVAKPVATVGGFQAIPLKYAKAAEVARTVRELLTTKTSSLAVSADDRRNLVLFRPDEGGGASEKRVRELVAELDVPAK